MSTKQPLAAPPDVVRWTARGGLHGDCAIAAVAMACGVTYETALVAACTICRNPLVKGMTAAQLLRAARALRCAAEWTVFERIHFEDATGILWLQSTQLGVKEDHVVYLWGGRIVEPKFDRQELWEDPEQFFSHYGYRVARMLTVTRNEDI